MGFARRLPVVLFVVAALVLSAFPLVPELFGRGKDKDYPLWYGVGQRVIYGADMYFTDPHGHFDFLYPPVAGVLLAGPSSLGKTGTVAVLTVGNVLSWWVAAWLSVRLATGGRPASRWVVVLPSVLCLPVIYEMFLLGQPNLFLLALVLGGFALVRSGRGWAAGVLFGAAAAIKAFPAVVVCYLVWRRHWRAAAGMLLAAATLLVLVPAPVRGFGRNLVELRQWADGMLLTHNKDGFSQRPERNLGWKNQSVLAVGHRFLRPIDADHEPGVPDAPPIRVNVADLDHKTAMLAILAGAGLVGVGFLAVMPARSRRTPQSDAAEIGILLTLTTVASPVSHMYYFVWLLFPVTYLVHRAVADPSRAVRRGTWAVLAASLGLCAAASPSVQPHWPQAIGVGLWAAAVMVGGLVWHLRRTAAPVKSDYFAGDSSSRYGQTVPPRSWASMTLTK